MTLHKRIVHEFPLMYDSRWIAFGCSPNVRHTAECCLPRLRNTSTSNVRVIFACRIRILFAFRCKRGLTASLRRCRDPFASLPSDYLSPAFNQNVSLIFVIFGMPSSDTILSWHHLVRCHTGQRSDTILSHHLTFDVLCAILTPPGLVSSWQRDLVRCHPGNNTWSLVSYVP